MKTSVTKMNTRLEQFLAAENISQSQFADNLGVARASISHILAGRNKPGYEFITNLMKCYPALNIEWLLAGKGKMYKESAQVSGLSQPQRAIEAPEEDDVTLFDQADSPTQVIENQVIEQSAPEFEQPIKKTISSVIVFYSDGTFQELR